MTVMQMTGGEAVVAALKKLGVAHVFGIVSVHNLPIYDAILRDGNITPISVRHEQAAAHAADGYARATGGLGVVIASTGPGTTNTMTGLFEAGFASSPVLLITGQVESTSYGKGKGVLHEAENQLAMLATVTRRAESVRRTEDIAATVVRAGVEARTGRPQPVAVEIPIDLQYRRADVDVPEPLWARVVPEESLLEQAAAALGESTATLIWAGGGVVAADATDALVELAERLHAPVVTTLNGRGAIAEDHPLALGATTTNRDVAALIAQADVVLAVGTRFQAGDTANGTLALPSKLLHIDADPGVLGLNYRPAIGICADARLGLEGLSKRAPTASGDGTFTERAVASGTAARAQSRVGLGSHEQIMDAIRAELPRDGVIVRDATVPAYRWGDRVIPILAPRTSLRPTSAAIGPGVPLALGAAIGSGRPTVVIQGDGGLMLSVGELATAVQHEVPIIVCVFNDRGYGIIRLIQRGRFEGRTNGVDLVTPDFAALAASVGMANESIADIDAFTSAFRRAVTSGQPMLLDIDMAALPMGGFPRN
jgi:acetolactate synthase-1/2/3 large subunit